jgi:hypothetical protein
MPPRRRAARRAGRRAGRRTARRTTRRVARRRAFRPAAYRRPVVRRPLGSLLILGATAGVAYKLGQNQAQQIEEYTGYPPDQLSEQDLQAAMNDLNIQPEPLDDADRQAISDAQGAPPPPAPASASQPDYIEELQRLDSLRDAGIITNEEFEAKKQQLLGL